jgi:hypothetical protein
LASIRSYDVDTSRLPPPPATLASHIFNLRRAIDRTTVSSSFSGHDSPENDDVRSNPTGYFLRRLALAAYPPRHHWWTFESLNTSNEYLVEEIYRAAMEAIMTSGVWIAWPYKAS